MKNEQTSGMEARSYRVIPSGTMLSPRDMARFMIGVRLPGTTVGLPARFFSDVVDRDRRVRLHAEVVVTDRPRIAMVMIDSDSSLTPTDLSALPWGKYLDAACEAAGPTRIEVVNDGSGITATPIVESEAASAVASIHVARRTKAPVTQETLETVARLYREAPSLNKPRGKHIAAQMHVSDSWARQLVGRARAEGLLPETTMRRATN